MIEETHYDTVNNFIDFYQSFKESSTKDLREFFQRYSPPINRRNHMCVSLGMEIVSRIGVLRPDIAEHFYLVSCEEAVENTISYIAQCEEKSIEAAAWSLEKEHSLVVMKIMIAGREGMMLLDPGYHVARAVTVMKDQLYPHTGFFTQSDEPGSKREYCYTFSHNSDSFITWLERTTRNGKEQSYEMSLIYVDRPYCTAIDVTVRRNLIYDFRSLLSRDAKGRVSAGIYFPVIANAADANITIFYDEGINNKILKTKVKFSVFKDISKVSLTFKSIPFLKLKLSRKKIKIKFHQTFFLDSWYDNVSFKKTWASNTHRAFRFDRNVEDTRWYYSRHWVCEAIAIDQQHHCRSFGSQLNTPWITLIINTNIYQKFRFRLKFYVFWRHYFHFQYKM